MKNRNLNLSRLQVRFCCRTAFESAVNTIQESLSPREGVFLPVNNRGIKKEKAANE
jgi:hypothetical protein